MKIEVTGNAAPGITAKDIVLAIIGKPVAPAAPDTWLNLRRRYPRAEYGRPHDAVQYGD
ncbi:hypothetical protein KCP74_00715 [Salmonella enterica subsp. enterica]|nr:hypothetical protein KCP74_00715 [Salmonella enterica subsp. enterica]